MEKEIKKLIEKEVSKIWRKTVWEIEQVVAPSPSAECSVSIKFYAMKEPDFEDGGIITITSQGFIARSFSIASKDGIYDFCNEAYFIDKKEIKKIQKTMKVLEKYEEERKICST